jgi:hypothetical protein
MKTKTSYKKGESGNPNGAPRAWETFKTRFRRYGEMPLSELQNIDLTVIKAKDAAVIKMIILWLQDDNISAVKEWMNREEGMPKQEIDQNNNNNNKSDVNIRFE